MYSTLDSYNWDGTNSLNNGVVAGGSGTWDAPPSSFVFNWTNSTGTYNVAWADGNIVPRFGGSAGTVTVPETRTVGGMQFSTAGYNFAGAGAIQLAQNATITLPGSGYTTFNVPFRGGYGLTVNGGGYMTMNALKSTYTGGTTVQGANLDLYANGDCSTLAPLGTGPVLVKSGGRIYTQYQNQFGCNGSSQGFVSGVTLEAGGVIEANASIHQQMPALTLAGGDLRSLGTVSGSAALHGVYILTGDVQVTADSTISAQNVNNVKSGGVVYNIAPGKNLYVTGYFGKGSSLADTGFMIAGGGTMKVLGTSTATGAISVINGVLRLGDGTPLGNINSHASVNLGASGRMVFVRSDSHTVSPPVSGAGGVAQYGNGTATLSGANTYTGSTLVASGALAYGAAGSVPAASAITVDAGATLTLNSLTGINRAADTTINGTLAMGTNASMTLASGTHTVNAITGSGTITVNSGATLVLPANLTNTGVNVVLAGGTLSIGSSAVVSLGAITLSANSTVDMAASGAASLRTSNLNPATFTLGVTNWVAGTDHFYATAVTGSPARNVADINPLNRVSLGGQPASFTYWASSDELLYAPSGTYWDTTWTNGAVDGGTGTWDSSTFNWTTVSGGANGPWAGGTSTATFSGTAGTVTVSGAQDVGGLAFTVAGYALTGTGLTLTQNANFTAPSSGSTTVGLPLTGNFGITTSGNLTFTTINTYTGDTVVASGTLTIRTPNRANNCSSGNTSTTLGFGALTIASGARVSIVDMGGGIWARDQAFGCLANQPGRAVTQITLRGTLDQAPTLISALPPLVFDGGDLSGGTYSMNYGVQALSNSTISSTAAGLNNTSFTISPAATLSVTGVLTGGNLSLAGGGRMLITGTNTATGAITVSNGTVQVGNGSTTGDIGTHSGVSLSAATGNLAFNRSDAYSFGKVISGSGNVLQQGAGALTLAAANTYSGATTVNAGSLVYGAATSVPAGSAVTVAAGATLNLNGLTGITRSADSTVNGTLALGTNAAMTLSSGTHTLAAITGSGTITVNSGATLTLPASFNNTSVNIVLAGGMLNIGAGAVVSLGTLSQTAASTVDFSSSGNATLTVATLMPGAYTMTVTNWTSGSDRFYATAVTGNPARMTVALAPLNVIKLGGNAAAATYWASGAPGELLANSASLVYWDPDGATAGVGGGAGTWDAASINWTDMAATLRGTWPGGTGVAVFQGAGAAVAVSGAQNIGGLTFNADGYTLSGGSLVLTQAATVAVASSGHTATIASPISGTFGVTLSGSGVVALTGTNTYTGPTQVNARVLAVSGSTASASAVTVASGSTLAGNGAVNGAVTVSGGLRPSAASGAAATAGTLLTGALTLNGTATTTLDLAAPGTLGGGVNDLVQVSGNVTLGGTLTINNLPGFSTSGNYTLLTYTGTRTGTFASNNLAALGYQGQLLYDDTNKQVLLVAIPRVRIVQVSNAGIGSFNFVLGGLDTATTSLTTTVAGTGVTSGIFSGTAGTAVTLTQTPPSGWPALPVSVNCVDANGASNGNGTGALGSLSGSALTLSSSQMRAGADISCTFTNALNGISGVVFQDGGAPSGGVNTGAPNDGLRNGSEGGIGGVAVRLTNCAATTHASATTDAGGAYSLAIPTAQVGQSVCVVAGSPTGYLATGANASGTVLPNGSATTVAGTAFTYTRASQQVGFTAPASGQVVLNFGQVKPSTLTPATSARQAAPNTKAVHAHTFTAGTGGSLQIALGAGTATPASTTGWSEIAYLDSGCTGTVQVNATRLYPSGSAVTVTQDQVVCFVVQEQVPPQAANGHSNAVPVTATLTFTNASPSLNASYTATDTSTASSSAVALTKEVRNITQGGSFGTTNQAKSGDVLEYRITYANTTTTAVTVFVINDNTPTYTTFQLADVGSLPAGLGSCTKVTPANPAPAAPVACNAAQAAGGSGSVSWRFTGTLSAGATGYVTYQVKVD